MGTDALDSLLRQRLFSGERLAFASSEPDAERAVSLRLVAEAARAGMRIDIENAVLVVDASLDHVVFARDVRLIACRFAGFVDLSYARFEKTLDLSGSEFTACASFDSVWFGGDVTMNSTRFAADPTHQEVIFNDCKVVGVLVAQQARFDDGVTARFPRAEFRSSAFFDGASFGGTVELDFAGVAGALGFVGARFSQGMSAYHLRVDKVAAFRGVRCALGAGMNFAESDLGTIDFERAVFGGAVTFRASRVRSSWLASSACFLRALDLTRMEISKDVVLDDGRIGKRGWLVMDATVVGRRISMNKVRFRGIVEIEGCFVGESLFARGARFQAAARFAGLKVGSDANFQGARFESSERANFGAARIAGKTDLQDVEFLSGATFRRARLGDFTFTGRSEDTLDLYGIDAAVVALNDARIRGRFVGGVRTALDLSGASAEHVYCDGARLRGDVAMIGLVVGTQLSFNDVIVAGFVDFYELRVERGVFVWRSRFLGALKLESATVHSLELLGSSFRRPVSLSASRFGTVLIGGEPRTERRAVFHDRFRAEHARIGRLVVGGADFRSATPTSFDHTKVEGAADFTDVVLEGGASFVSTGFGGEARLVRVRFGASADFRSARFEGTATIRGDFDDRADFSMARFRSVADFGGSSDEIWELGYRVVTSSCRFRSLDFSYAEFSGDLQLQGAQIREDLVLRQCVIASVLLPQPASALPDRVDLRGCRYGHIDLDVAGVTRPGRTGEARLQPHSMQPYTDLERVVRKLGDSETADQVHLAGCRAERKHRWRTRKSAWLSSSLYGVFLNYGVRPYRLAIYACVLIAFFTFYFSHRGTLQHDLGDAPPITYDASSSEAFAVSLREFFPIELPILEHIVPGPIDWPAAILKLFGLVLVPLGLAAVTGILRRQETS